MKIVLDTNALIWVLGSPTGGQLGLNAKRSIDTADTVFASAISVLEIRIKEMLGKLEAPDALLPDITAAGLEMLPFIAEHAERLQDFPDLARHDPFDRMLLAQAKYEGLLLLTSDTVLLRYKLDFVIDARQ